MIRPPESRCPTTNCFMAILKSTAPARQPPHLGVEIKAVLLIYLGRHARRPPLLTSPRCPSIQLGSTFNDLMSSGQLAVARAGNFCVAPSDTCVKAMCRGRHRFENRVGMGTLRTSLTVLRYGTNVALSPGDSVSVRLCVRACGNQI